MVENTATETSSPSCCGSVETEVAVTKRDSGFFLIGAGIGLMLSFVSVWRITAWMHHMFILGIRPEAYIWMSLPWVFLIAGSLLLRQQRRRI